METKIYPWRLEGRATPFSRWMVIGYSMRLRDAVTKVEAIRIAHRYYVTRVRAN